MLCTLIEGPFDGLLRTPSRRDYLDLPSEAATRQIGSTPMARTALSATAKSAKWYACHALPCAFCLSCVPATPFSRMNCDPLAQYAEYVYIVCCPYRVSQTIRRRTTHQGGTIQPDPSCIMYYTYYIILCINTNNTAGYQVSMLVSNKVSTYYLLT